MAWVKRLLGGRVIEQAGHRIEWESGRLQVAFPSGRTQRIRYEERNAAVRLVTVVAYRADLEANGLDTESVAHLILRRNRETRVVAFGLGRDLRIEAWVSTPKEHLQARELVYYVMTLAREADRFEYLLTRSDRT